MVAPVQASGVEDSEKLLEAAVADDRAAANLAPADPHSGTRHMAGMDDQSAAKTYDNTLGSSGGARPPAPALQEPTMAERSACGLAPWKRSSSSLLRVAGLTATFTLSGLMHELLLCISTGDTSQLGKQAAFFAIQVRVHSYMPVQSMLYLGSEFK